ncbi:hypothetical protein BIW11_03425 [Tropilaelaps mercedesae]|uniref:Uncharacterized protein n=1 Tax=Tropilaelaps mercedesae TaxID=418985 RepID=A0A1V9XLM4_9ACAR|nr:hypothetical protein BIW11_03425 [Tropilaelaps mercedesae]
MDHPRYAVLLWAVTAGSQGDSLGADETDTVALGWCVVDLANTKDWCRSVVQGRNIRTTLGTIDIAQWLLYRPTYHQQTPQAHRAAIQHG